MTDRAELQAANERIARLEEALASLTIWSVNGEQLCFRTSNNVPMGMSKKQERLARRALTPLGDVENEQWNPPRPGSNVPIMCQKCKGKGWVPA